MHLSAVEKTLTQLDSTDESALRNEEGWNLCVTTVYMFYYQQGSREDIT